MKYKGIGFNGPHLATMPFEKLQREVAHQLNDEEIKDLYNLLQLKYPGAVKTAPELHANDNIPISETADTGHGSDHPAEHGADKGRARRPERGTDE